MGDFLTGVFLILFILLCGGLSFYFRYSRFWRITRYLEELKEKQETKLSTIELTHKHSENWAYVKQMTHWRTRLYLCRYRGKEWDLTWRISLLKFFNIVGPQTAQWLMEEYMITAKVTGKSAGADAWRCGCGTENPNTALFCKDCGQYK